MRKLQLVPLSGESVDQKVSAFRQYTDEVRTMCYDLACVGHMRMGGGKGHSTPHSCCISILHRFGVVSQTYL